MEKGADPLFSAISYPRDMVGKRERFPQRWGRERVSTWFPRGIHREMWEEEFRACERGDGLRRPTFPSSWKSGEKSRKKPKVSSLPCALWAVETRCCVPHVHGSFPISSRQRTASATAPLPLMPTPNNAFGSTVAAHERQRRKREVSSSYGTTKAGACERVVYSIKTRKV